MAFVPARADCDMDLIESWLMFRCLESHGGREMKVGSKAAILIALIIMVGSAGLTFGQNSPQPSAQTPPPNRVIAAYFHRTQRCPTCLRVSQTVAKILKDHFSEQMRSGQLQWVEVDFQAPQNAHLAKAYQITGPQIVLIRVENGRAVEWQPMPKVWSLLIKPQELDQYVTSGVEGYLHQLARGNTNALR